MKPRDLIAAILPMAVMAALEPPQRSITQDEARRWRERERNQKKNPKLSKGAKRKRALAGFVGKPLGQPTNNARTRKLRGLPTKLEHLHFYN